MGNGEKVDEADVAVFGRNLTKPRDELLKESENALLDQTGVAGVRTAQDDASRRGKLSAQRDQTQHAAFEGGEVESLVGKREADDHDIGPFPGHHDRKAVTSDACVTAGLGHVDDGCV